MTELRQRMVNDLIIRGMAEKTRKVYTEAVAGLAKLSLFTASECP